MIMGAKNGDMDITPAHLAGKTLGVQVSTTHQAYAEKYYAESTIKDLPDTGRGKSGPCSLEGLTMFRQTVLLSTHS